jgi:hypothetical protein
MVDLCDGFVREGFGGDEVYRDNFGIPKKLRRY